MPYSELMIRPMREELTRIGVEELRTPEDVEDAGRQQRHGDGGRKLDLRLRRGKSETGNCSRAATQRATGQSSDCVRRRRY